MKEVFLKKLILKNFKKIQDLTVEFTDKKYLYLWWKWHRKDNASRCVLVAVIWEGQHE